MRGEMKVYQAIAAVSAELAKSGISKSRSNVEQKYKFRGIDETLNALAPLLSAKGLVIVPRILSRSVAERQTRNGNALFSVVVEAEFDLVAAEDGSHVTVRTFGEAMDTADKATNKAMSVAYKYAAFLTFCIPVEGMAEDADAVTHEVAIDHGYNDFLAALEVVADNGTAALLETLKTGIVVGGKPRFGADEATWERWLERLRHETNTWNALKARAEKVK